MTRQYSSGLPRGVVILGSDLSGDPSAQSFLGAVGGFTNVIEVTPTLSVTGSAYSTGDYVGSSGTAMVFDGCSRVDGGSGLVISCEITDNKTQSAAGELWLFDIAIVPPSDNAPWSISDSDMKHRVAILPFSTYFASALNSGATAIPTVPAGFQCAVGSKKLYGCHITRGSPSYGLTDLTYRLVTIPN
jgi:hypothetical protein